MSLINYAVEKLVSKKYNTMTEYAKHRKTVILITNILKEAMNQVFSGYSDSSLMILIPRMDFKGFGWIPQIFMILPLKDFVSSSITSTTTEKPIVNQLTRNIQYASYNLVAQAETISLNKGLLLGLLPEMIEKFRKSILTELLGDHFLTNYKFSANLAKRQLKERVSQGIYFTMYSPSIGFYETVTVNAINTNKTVNYNECQISISMTVTKGFDIFGNKVYIDNMPFAKDKSTPQQGIKAGTLPWKLPWSIGRK